MASNYEDEKNSTKSRIFMKILHKIKFFKRFLLNIKISEFNKKIYINYIYIVFNYSEFYNSFSNPPPPIAQFILEKYLISPFII
jgi:hypothetical protein